jgi:hypothetical protein
MGEAGFSRDALSSQYPCLTDAAHCFGLPRGAIRAKQRLPAPDACILTAAFVWNVTSHLVRLPPKPYIGAEFPPPHPSLAQSVL